MPNFAKSPVSNSQTSLINLDDFVEIDELGDGEIFGDYALLNEEELECSYITSIPSEIIQLSAFDLRKIVPAENLEVFFR